MSPPRKARPSSPTQAFAPNEWVVFDRVLVVNDTFNGGTRTFLDAEDAKLFREMLYSQVGGGQETVCVWKGGGRHQGLQGIPQLVCRG
jgi:hypothetical protein